MKYRADKFQVGDMATWFNDEYAIMIGSRSKYGDGPFKVLKVLDRDYYMDKISGQSNYSSMGHTQHILVENAGDDYYSGAFFKKV